MIDFDQAFEALTGHRPFPWQQRLYHDWFAAERPDNTPGSCSLPTGLGKTNVIAIWLIALASGAKVPRRLVYIVNRRTVVDQTTAEAERFKAAVDSGKLPGISELADRALDDLAELPKRADRADSLGALRGIEGSIAAIYFQHFALMLKPRDFDARWDFTHRNRRPPRDPVNALLSFGYAMLAKECAVALLSEGLDPWWGFYHQPRHGRPALALGLMEPFRPAVVDSAVITAINTGMVQQRNFQRSAAGCILRPAGRKAFLRAYESRLDQLVTHPVFDYRCSWRTVIRLRARLLARWLRGDIGAYTSLVTR